MSDKRTKKAKKLRKNLKRAKKLLRDFSCKVTKKQLKEIQRMPKHQARKRLEQLIAADPRNKHLTAKERRKLAKKAVRLLRRGMTIRRPSPGVALPAEKFAAAEGYLDRLLASKANLIDLGKADPPFCTRESKFILVKQVVFKPKKFVFCKFARGRFIKSQAREVFSGLEKMRKEMASIIALKNVFFCAACDRTSHQMVLFKQKKMIFAKSFCFDLLTKYREYLVWKNSVLINYVKRLHNYAKCFEKDGGAKKKYPYRFFSERVLKTQRKILECTSIRDAKQVERCLGLCSRFSVFRFTRIFDGDLRFLKKIYFKTLSTVRMYNFRYRARGAAAKPAIKPPVATPRVLAERQVPRALKLPRVPKKVLQVSAKKAAAIAKKAAAKAVPGKRQSKGAALPLPRRKAHIKGYKQLLKVARQIALGRRLIKPADKNLGGVSRRFNERFESFPSRQPIAALNRFRIEFKDKGLDLFKDRATATLGPDVLRLFSAEQHEEERVDMQVTHDVISVDQRDQRKYSKLLDDSFSSCFKVKESKAKEQPAASRARNLYSPDSPSAPQFADDGQTVSRSRGRAAGGQTSMVDYLRHVFGEALF